MRNGEASVYKVAHHGSENAHHQPIWDTVLSTHPWTLITPFTRGKKILPSPQDIDRIASQTDKAYITATASAKKTKKRKLRDPLVKRFVNKSTRYIKYIEPRCGHIMMRKPFMDSANSWNVELFEGAHKLR